MTINITIISQLKQSSVFTEAPLVLWFSLDKAAAVKRSWTFCPGDSHMTETSGAGGFRSHGGYPMTCIIHFKTGMFHEIFSIQRFWDSLMTMGKIYGEIYGKSMETSNKEL